MNTIVHKCFTALTRNRLLPDHSCYDRTMLHIAISIFSLLLASAILLLGVGLQGTLIALRAGVEGFSVETTGMVMAAYFIGYALGTRICPSLIRQFGHIRTYAILATIASAVAVAYPLVPSPLTWFVLRVVTGISMVGLFIVIESWLNEVAPGESRGRFFAVYMLITLMAMALGQFIILAGDVRSFDLFAITTILISLALVPVAMTRVRQPEPVASVPLKLVTLYRNSPMGVGGAAIAGMVNGAFWGMSPVFASSIGLNELHIALFISLTVLGGALLQWPVGLLSDRFDRRTVLTATALLGCIVALLMHTSVSLRLPEAALLASSFLFGGFAFSIYSLSVAHVNDRLEAGQSLEAARSMLQLYGIGAAIGPILAGYTMKSLGTTSLLLFFSAWLLLLGLYSYYRLRTTEAPPEALQASYVPLHQTTPVALEMSPQLSGEGDTPRPAQNTEEGETTSPARRADDSNPPEQPAEQATDQSPAHN